MAKKNGLRRALDTKYVRFGGYSAVISAVAIAIVIIVNLLVNALPATFTKLDTSNDKIFTISDETKEIIRSIGNNITMYLIVSSGNEDDQLVRFMERYTSENSKIKQDKVDPVMYPDFIKTYTDEDLAENSIIVVNNDNKRAFAVDYSDIYVTEYSDEEMYNYYLYGTTPTGTTSFAGEQALTSALDYVTETDLPTVYYTTGHGEATVTDTISKLVTSENINTASVSLMTDGGIPTDATALMINTPTADFTSEEIELLQAYVSAGGKILLISSYEYPDLTNLYGFMATYGMSYVKGIVAEGSSSYCYNNYPTYLVPKIGSNDISDKAGSNVYIVLPNSHGIRVSDNLPDNITVTKLLTTTESAFAKVGLQENDEIKKADTDESGPFQIGVLATVTNTNADEGQLVWFSSPDIISDLTSELGNHTYFMATLTTLCNKQSSISIASKSMQVTALSLSDTGVAVWSALIIAIVPGILFVLGFVRWNARRKR
jgi:ABC-type uncharacterized transport system.